jgi:glycosyltransferase involved in cell wall biosynthesis
MISIALASYNGSKFLRQQLESFSKQTRPPDELVVCDDASTDDTLDILERFRAKAPFPVRIFQNPENMGLVRNFEKALSLCEGDLIFLSDQDDAWHSTKLEVVELEFARRPNIDLIINDAFYANENLIVSGITVLQRVLSVGANEYGHIAGACTAIRSRFRDFLVPFPEGGCCQHDVYIHSWANLIGNKYVIAQPLQEWRVHGRNATSDNEMQRGEFESIFKRYRTYKNVDAANDYLNEADEYYARRRIIDERAHELAQLPMAPTGDILKSRIDGIIFAHLARAKIARASWLEKKRIAFTMLFCGQYRYFKGLLSFVKDLLR